MRPWPRALLAALLLQSAAALPLHAQPANNASLQALMIDDQRDRTGSRGKPWNPEVDVRDRERREAGLAELRAGRVLTSTDHYNLAMLMQHGEHSDDYRLAHALAWTAYTMREDGVPKREAGWLAAAAMDRLLISLGRPQWYGTQYHRDPVTNRPGDRYPYDETALSPAERNKLLAPLFEPAP